MRIESPNHGAAGQGEIVLLFQTVHRLLALPEHGRSASASAASQTPQPLRGEIYQGDSESRRPGLKNKIKTPPSPLVSPGRVGVGFLKSTGAHLNHNLRPAKDEPVWVLL